MTETYDQRLNRLIRMAGRESLPTRRADVSNGNSAIGFGIGYDAVRSKGRRTTPQGRVLSEDQELRQLPRRQMTTSIRDLNRNFAIARWMIQRHLDYVSTFHFRAKTPDKTLNQQIESLMQWWSRPENCDPASRSSLPRMIRMWEMRRVIDGDCLVNRLADGRVQTIEGDRIQTVGSIPFSELGITDTQWVINGVWVTESGRPISYMVHKRQPLWTGLEFDRAIPARFADLFGYFDRVDQVRGISPLAAAANTLRDCYEGLEYALVKAKASQLLGILFTRAGGDEGAQENLQKPAGESVSDGEECEPRYAVDLNRGPLTLDLEPGDDAKIIESATPSTEFQSFTQVSIMIALKALDIPFSFFDEAHTNYSGARMAGTQFYEAAVKIKQHDLRVLLNKITAWRLGLFIADAELKLPRGMQMRDLQWHWEHAGVPLYDPMKEITASIAAINAAMSSPQRECQRLGYDFFQLIDEKAEAEAYAKQKGVVLSTALPATAMDDPSNSKTQTEDQNVEQEADDEKPAGKNRKAKANAQVFWDRMF